jgi:hypothetical protein
LAEYLGISKVAIMEIIEKLIKKGLVEKDEETKYLRSTSKWYESVVVDNLGKESLSLVKKVYQCGKESIPTAGKESLPNSNSIDSNNYKRREKITYEPVDNFHASSAYQKKVEEYDKQFGGGVRPCYA